VAVIKWKFFVLLETSFSPWVAGIENWAITDYWRIGFNVIRSSAKILIYIAPRASLRDCRSRSPPAQRAPSTLSCGQCKPQHYPSGGERHHLQPLQVGALKNLGLNPQKVTELSVKVHAYPVQCAYKVVSTRRALEKTFATNHHQDQEHC